MPVSRAPQVLCVLVEIFLQPAMGLVDAGVEHHLGRPLGDLLGRHLGEQDDRIMVELAPLDWIEIAKEVDDLGMPAPPQIVWPVRRTCRRVPAG